MSDVCDAPTAAQEFRPAARFDESDVNSALLTGKKSPRNSPSKASGEIPEVASSGRMPGKPEVIP